MTNRKSYTGFPTSYRRSAISRIEVTRASRGLSAIAELLVNIVCLSADVEHFILSVRSYRIHPNRPNMTSPFPIRRCSFVNRCWIDSALSTITIQNLWAGA